jgi:hypothetical protein
MDLGTLTAFRQTTTARAGWSCGRISVKALRGQVEACHFDCVKEVTFACKSLFIGDDVAAALVEYARLLADTSGADSITMRALDPAGHVVDATFLLTATSVLLMQSSSPHAEPPDNHEALSYIEQRIDAITTPIRPEAIDSWETWDYDMDGSL